MTVVPGTDSARPLFNLGPGTRAAPGSVVMPIVLFDLGSYLSFRFRVNLPDQAVAVIENPLLEARALEPPEKTLPANFLSLASIIAGLVSQINNMRKGSAVFYDAFGIV